jgi:TrmH family RNA methyltransferase
VPATRRITSRQHPFIQRCRAVADRRAGHAAVLLDGEHLVLEAVRAGLTLEGVLTGDRPHTLDAAIAALGIPHYAGTTAVLAAASPVRTPSGVVAIAEWSPAPPVTLLAGSAPLVVGLVDVQDPGNVGSVIRSAHALGASGVLALGASADPAGWKALRGAMGSTFHLAVGRGAVDEAIEAARLHGVTIAAAVAHGGTAIDRTALAPPLLLLAGNEGAGLSAGVLDRADRQVRIPLRPGVESLNVAVTTALVLWELRRRPRDPDRPAPA